MADRMTGRQVNRISARGFASLMRDGAKPGRHGDGGGLHLSVGPGGARRWVFLFRWQGRLREMGLGSAHKVGLAMAREKAEAARQLLGEGRNPLDAKRETLATPMFGAFAKDVVASLAPQWRNPKHKAQWESTLANDAAALKSMPVDAIATDDVLRVLKPLWQEKPETAARLRGRIERVLDAAAAKGYRTGENPARWKGHLENLLPARQKLTRGHHAAMAWKDLPAFLRALRGREGASARALEFTVLTAARSGEVRGATWAEIDLDTKLWRIPAQRMKAGREHVVPLTAGALAVLEAVKPLTGGKPDAAIFPGKRNQPLSDMSLSAVLRRMKIAMDKASVHGFRSAFRDWAGDATGFEREIVEAALAHTLGAVERAYRRGSAIERRRALMAAWETYCERGAMPGADVVAMARG
ncbi:MAG: Integrase [Oceanicaulis sp. HLUCCA04]|nr:MAG: Integrase [Oceanicaulis sp. HLUCCA04]